MFHSKNNQAAEKSYGNGSDMEKFANETDIKNSGGNDLMAKGIALKSFENLLYRYNFIIKFHNEQFL